MTNATAEFFRELGNRGHEPLFGKAKGTIRFDLADGTQIARWLVSLDEGDVSVSRRNVAADCVVRAERSLFDRMASGEANGMAATLRNEVTYEGDPELLVIMQRVLPGPARRSRP